MGQFRDRMDNAPFSRIALARDDTKKPSSFSDPRDSANTRLGCDPTRRATPW